MAIRPIVTKFCTKFTFLDTKPPTRLRIVRTEEMYRYVCIEAFVRDIPAEILEKVCQN